MWLWLICICVDGWLGVGCFYGQVDSLVATYLRTGIAKLSTLRDKLETS